MDDFTNLKPGAVLIRATADRVERVRVLRIDDDIIICTPLEEPVEGAMPRGRVWCFDRLTGAEITIGTGYGFASESTGGRIIRSPRTPMVRTSAVEISERLLGGCGRMITASKARYAEKHHDHVVVFNGNLCTRGRGKIWFGDLDLTKDEPLLLELAAALADSIYVLEERDSRFATEHAPRFENHLLKISANGTIEARHWMVRSDDGRLRRRPQQGDG